MFIGRKRQRISHSGSSELSSILPISNYNENENISDILNNSKEITKILSEGITSPICKEFLKNMDLDSKYIISYISKIKFILKNLICICFFYRLFKIL